MKNPVERFDCVNRVKTEKSLLLRIVRRPDGSLEVDPTGKMNGRGAYLRADEATLALARKNRALERALATKIPEEIYQKIGRYLHD